MHQRRALTQTMDPVERNRMLERELEAVRADKAIALLRSAFSAPRPAALSAADKAAAKSLGVSEASVIAAAQIKSVNTAKNTATLLDGSEVPLEQLFGPKRR